MKKVQSILEFDGGSIVRKMNLALKGVIKNIADPLTDCGTRTVVLKMKLVPSEQDRDNIAITSTVETKLRPEVETKVGVQLYFDQEEIAIKERLAVVDGQIDTEGAEHEAKYVEL